MLNFASDLFEVESVILSDNMFEITRVNPEDIKKKLTKLRLKLDKINECSFALELRSILASYKCGHLDIPNWITKLQKGYLSVKFANHGSKLILASAHKNKSNITGAEVQSICGMDIDKIKAKFISFIPSDNIYQVSNQLPYSLDCIDVLEYLQIKRKDEVEVVVTEAGKSHKIDGLEDTTDFVEQEEINNFGNKFTVLNDGILLLVYSECFESEHFRIVRIIKKLKVLIEAKKRYKFIIDLRFNSGGDDSVIIPLIDYLESRKEYFEIVVIIGNETFSSAVTNAIDLKTRLNAILVGNNTGGAIISPGENKSKTLPFSKLILEYPTRIINRSRNKNIIFKDYSTLSPDIPFEMNQKFDLVNVIGNIELPN